MNDELKSSLRNARRLAKLLDTEFGIGRFKVGLDPIIGLLPIAGDTIALLLSSYIVLTAFKFDLPKITKFKMLFNLLFDYVIGLIPVIGDLFDFAFKSNKRNMRLLERYLNAE